MRKVFRFAMVALAAAAFAGCSNEDLFDGNGNLSSQGKGGIQVEVEELMDPLTTRAALTSGNKLYWQTSDTIRVYDDNLFKYARYYFNGSSFVKKDGDNAVKLPKFALFGDTITNTNWAIDDQRTVATYVIPTSWKWAEDETVVGDEGQTLAYQSNLPMWGTAEKDETGDGVKVKLNYLTGVLRVDLKNVPDNAIALKVEGWTDDEASVRAQMSGKFTAVLADENSSIVDAAELIPADETVPADLKWEAGVFADVKKKLGSKNAIVVDIKAAKKSTTTVFIPLIAQHYGQLKVYWLPAGATSTHIVKNADEIDTDDKTMKEMAWQTLGWKQGVTIKRGAVYTMVHEGFKDRITGGSIRALNTALASRTEETGAVNLAATMETTAAADDYTLIIPAGMKSEAITLDLQSLKVVKTTKLVIKSEDGKYAGKFTLKVPVLDGTLSNIHVNLPEADVTFAGAFTNTILGDTKWADGTLLVKTLTIAAEEQAEDAGTSVEYGFDAIYPNAACCKGNSDDADILVTEGAKVGNIILSNNTKVNAITINGEAGTVNAAPINDGSKEDIVVDVTIGKGAKITKLTTHQTEVNVPEEAEVATLEAESAKTVTVEGTISKMNIVNATSVTVDGGSVPVFTLGDEVKAEITLTDATVVGDGSTGIKALAATKFTMSGESTITMNGYVNVPKAAATLAGNAKINSWIRANTLTVSGTAYADAANVDGDVTVNESEEHVALKSLKMKDGKTLTLSGGYIEKIATSDTEAEIKLVNEEATKVPTAFKTVESNVTIKTTTSKWGGAKVSDDYQDYAYTGTNIEKLIYTASQLVSITEDGGYLANNIDLNNIKMEPLSHDNLHGKDKTISHVNINSTTASNVGLFAEISTGVVNLTIDGITVTGTKAGANVGALAGLVKGGNVENITVKNATLTGTNTSAVGGIAGKVTTAAVELKKMAISGTTSLTGAMLGGLVGKMGSNLTLTNCTVPANISYTHSVPNNNTTYYGMISNGVGTADSNLNLKVTGGSLPTLTVGQKTNFDKRIKTETVNSGTVGQVTLTFAFYGREQIGYVDMKADDTFSLNDAPVAKAEVLTEMNGNQPKDKSGLNIYVLK